MSVFDVSLYEPIDAVVTADNLSPTVDSLAPTADGGVLAGATDSLDAAVISAVVEVGGGGLVRPLKPFPIVGVGFGILPQLEGEAFGAVGVVGNAVGTLPRIRGAAEGTIGIAGRSVGEFAAVRAAVHGKIGAAGRADAVFGEISVAAAGAIAAQGSGAGVIAKFQASASGRHDDAAAAVMAFLLAA